MFTADNPQPGPGRPKGSRNAISKLHLQDLMKQAVPDDKIIAIFQKLVERAELGSVDAAKLCLEYRLGKPRQVMEIEASEVSMPDDLLEGISIRYAERVLQESAPEKLKNRNGRKNGKRRSNGKTGSS